MESSPRPAAEPGMIAKETAAVHVGGRQDERHRRPDWPAAPPAVATRERSTRRSRSPAPAREARASLEPRASRRGSSARRAAGTPRGPSSARCSRKTKDAGPEPCRETRAGRQADQQEGPGSDPIEERAAADLLVEKEKEQEQQERPCRLDEQGKLVDGHQVFVGDGFSSEILNDAGRVSRKSRHGVAGRSKWQTAPPRSLWPRARGDSGRGEGSAASRPTNTVAEAAPLRTRVLLARGSGDSRPISRSAGARQAASLWPPPPQDIAARPSRVS